MSMLWSICSTPAMLWEPCGALLDSPGLGSSSALLSCEACQARSNDFSFATWQVQDVATTHERVLEDLQLSCHALGAMRRLAEHSWAWQQFCTAKLRGVSGQVK